MCKNKNDLEKELNTFDGVLFYSIACDKENHRYSNDLHTGESIICMNRFDKWIAKVTKTENGWNIK